MSERWDLDAIKQGASVAATFAVPFTLIARFAFDDDDDERVGRGPRVGVVRRVRARRRRGGVAPGAGHSALARRS